MCAASKISLLLLLVLCELAFSQDDEGVAFDPPPQPPLHYTPYETMALGGLASTMKRDAWRRRSAKSSVATVVVVAAAATTAAALFSLYCDAFAFGLTSPLNLIFLKKKVFEFSEKGEGICNTGDNDCCTEDNQCGIGEGDCDSDDDCLGDLVCGDDNCAASDLPPGLDPALFGGNGFSGSDDCCTVPGEIMTYMRG